MLTKINIELVTFLNYLVYIIYNMCLQIYIINCMFLHMLSLILVMHIAKFVFYKKLS